MRRIALFVAAAEMMSLASAARGNLAFYGTEENLGNGYHRLMYFVRNDGANGTGSRMTSSDIILSSDRTTFLTRFVNGAASAKADLTGSALYLNAGSDPTALYHSDRTFINLLGNWNSSTTDPTAYTVTSTNPLNSHVNFLGDLSWLEVGGTNAAGVDATATVNYGLGALMAVAIVPWNDPGYGASVQVHGTVGTETGATQTFELGVHQNLFPPFPPPPPFPEPTGAAAIGFLLLLRRPRRS